jgi:hypothetical protein
LKTKDLKTKDLKTKMTILKRNSSVPEALEGTRRGYC